MFPRCIVGFLQIEKHGNYTLFLYESFAYEAFKSLMSVLIQCQAYQEFDSLVQSTQAWSHASAPP